MMTRDTYRRIAVYARARYDEAAAQLFEASAETGSMLEVYQPGMRPWLVGLLVKLGAPLTAEELATKEDAFLLGYLACKLAAEMGPPPADIAEPIAPTEQDRADARAMHRRGDRESEEDYAARVDHQARVFANQRASAAHIASRPPEELPRSSEYDRAIADQWKRPPRKVR